MADYRDVENNLTTKSVNDTGAATHDPSELFQRKLITVLGIYTTGLLCTFGILGNILSFIVLGKENNKLPLYKILRALAFSDSCLLFTTLLLQVLANSYDYTGAFYDILLIQGWVAEVVWPMTMMCQMSSVWLTVLTSIERWIAVCFPLKSSRLCTGRRARISVACVVLVSIAYNVPRFWEYKPEPIMRQNPFHVNETDWHWIPRKTELGENHIYRYLYATGFYFVIIFFLPLILITVFNVQLVWTLKKARQQWAHVNRRVKKEHKITVIPVCIVVVFYICATPALLANVLDSIFVHIETTEYDSYLVVSNMLTTLNSAVNFIIYCLLGRKFRQTLWKLVCIRRTKHKLYLTAKNTESIENDTL